MKLLRWFIDHWLSFRIWLAQRREMHEAREDRHARELLSRDRELADLRGQLAIQQEHEKFLALVIAKQRAIYEADIAVNVRIKADATGTPQSKQ